ncbi:MAG: AAA family ATPase, partial [Actinomycetota bacterium]|nr:AAA family ATPase [Actinomycetota bacterium]
MIEDQTLSITSAGSFPEGITLGNLLAAPPQPRNPRLADAFKRAGLVERTGRGVNRVFRSQLVLGRPQPDYSRSTGSWVEVRLRPTPADRELAAFAAQAGREAKPLSLQTLQVVHEVRAERRITSARTAEVLQLSTDEARAILND